MNGLTDYTAVFLDMPGYLGYWWMAGKFCRKYLSASGKKEALFIFLSFVGCFVFGMADWRYHGWYMLFELLYHIWLTGLTLWCFEAGWEKKILAASMLITVMRLAVNIFGSFLSCLVLFFQHTWQGASEPVVSGWASGLVNLAGFCMAAWIVYWMMKRMESVFCGKPGKWYVLLAMPLLVIDAVFIVAQWGASQGIMVRSGGNMGLYYDQIFSHMEFAVLALLSLAAAAFYVFGMDRIYLEQKKNSQYQMQSEVYIMLTEQYRQSERLRHDMKNHIIALSGLYESKEWEKLGDYLKKLEESSLADYGELTGNKAVDALLHQKRKRAEAGKVHWECDVQIPSGCEIHEFDLCILFGNLLDNALAACEKLPDEKRRFVQVQAKTVKKCFLIEIKNSADFREKETGGFAQREKPFRQGIGLLNVGDVVRGHQGTWRMEAGDGVFWVSVLIPLPDTAHDVKMTV